MTAPEPPSEPASRTPSEPSGPPGELPPVDVESRLAATVGAIVAAALSALLPSRVAVHPRWLLPALAAALALALFAMTTRWPVVAEPANLARHRRARVAALVMTGLLSVVNFVTGLRLVVDILRHQGIHDATVLLWAGSSVWLVNVIVFALWYWELDRGGRVARALGEDGHDFLFPQWTVEPPFGSPDWEPEFLDYFYFAFTNAAAFSPTDVMPLSRWAKLAMLLQSALSIGIILLVVANAINIL